MNSRVKKTVAGISIFLILSLAVLAVIWPVYARITGAFHEFEEKYIMILEEKTGLSIRYKSLSPSILTGIHIKDVEVYDTESGEMLLIVKKVSIGYSLSSLLKKDFEHAFTRLNINNVSIDYNGEKYPAFTKKLTQLMEANATKDKETVELTDELLNSIKDMLFILPFDVQIRNVRGSFSSPELEATALLDKIILKKDTRGKSIQLDLSGMAKATLELLDEKSAGAEFELHCRILDSLPDSSFVVSLDDYGECDYSVKKMEFLIRYGEGIVTVNSMQQYYPYELSASYDIAKRTASAGIQTQDLNPFVLVKMPSIPEQLRIVEGTTVSVTASADISLDTLEYNWKARGGVSLARKILNSSEWVDFNARGDNYNIYLDSFSASGYILGATGYGKFNIARMEPNLTLSVDHFRIPGGNGNPLSADLYVDSYKGTYNLFIPQLYLGERNFTAVQAEVLLKNSAVDFALSLSDYSHQEYDNPGEINLEGTFIMGRKNVLEALVDIDNLFIDSVLYAVSYMLDEETASTLVSAAGFAEPFIMSTEVYFSTDMKSLSFNSPYTILANTRADRQLLLLSFDGNEQSVYLSQLDLVYNDIAFQATANAEMSAEDKQIVFSTDFNLNSLPYHFSGSVTDGKWINVTGDYGFDVLVSLGKTISGTVQFSMLPVAYRDFLFYAGLRAGFEYTPGGESFITNPFKLTIESLELEEGSDVLGFKPKVSLMGAIDNSGLMIESLAYTDTTSSLDGTGYAMWNIVNSRFENLNINFLVQNPVSTENITIDGSITNTFGSQELTLENILQYSVDIQVGINAFYMGRFMEFQVADDTFNATVSATGTLGNPSVILNIRKLTLDLAGIPFNARGSVNLGIIGEDEWDVDISDFNASWSILNIDDVRGSIELRNFTGRISGGINADVAGAELSMPFTVDLLNLSPESESFITENFMMIFESSLNSNVLEESIPVYAEVVRMPGMWVFNTDDFLKTSGYFMDTGALSLNIDESRPFHCNVTGSISGKYMDIDIKNLYCDLPEFAFLFNSPMFSLYNGRLNGNVLISGLQTDPAITGYISLDSLDFNMPDYVSDHFTARQLKLNFNQDNFVLPESSIHIRDTNLNVSASMILNCWQLENFELKAKTEGNKGLPFDVKIPFLSARGRLGLDATVTLEGNSLDVGGSVFVKNTDITVLDLNSETASFADNLISGKTERKTKNSSTPKSSSPAMDIKIQVELLIGEKVQFIVNPLLRGMMAQNTPVSFVLDTENGFWTVKGDVALRGGEVSYLSRNFYIKEGSVSLSESNEKMDPVITLRAEAREHDEDGNPVTIILSIQNQAVSQLSPRLYANPAKSESEILSLLGQVATGDSKDFGSLLVAGVDYGVQVTVLRKIENSLRDLFNFDIFSIRSSVLQNAIKQGLNLNSDGSEKNSVSNYFDNSTVYIGKYFGDSIYADAMLHWSYDESLAGDYDAGKGLWFNANSWAKGFVFQPELGLEVESPFANIRWSMAPDWGNLQETLVPSTSLTLSWRLTF